MDDMNNNNSSKPNLNKKQKSAILVSIVTLLAISFCASYFITNYLTNPNRKNEDINTQNVIVDNNYLNDNIFVTLKTNDTVDMVDNLLNVKKKLNLKDKLTEEELSEELSKEGYVLSEKNEQKLTYTRDEEVSNDKFQANKYYLGEEDGYISIFKTDENGNIIESEKKVYTDSKPIANLPETDQNYIKEHKFFFDAKDDALQKLSEMIS
ncbi:hypothetical protein R0131_06480 [Clostridium sp. AL.422]|uniref:hypothetical protein n=1 Tax=Clostridium TaxID=1485 RepID=UPI00293DF9CA|nr:MULTISPECIES: hypothetical protein [unclassified Clostridium]MDV4150476.1 hypothetical protein [Clostridium sp. AL.422]